MVSVCFNRKRAGGEEEEKWRRGEGLWEEEVKKKMEEVNKEKKIEGNQKERHLKKREVAKEEQDNKMDGDR